MKTVSVQMQKSARVAEVIRWLGSRNDGDVLAAARQLRLTLAEAGVTFREFSRLVKPVIERRLGSGMDSEDEAVLPAATVAERILEHAGELTVAEAEFVGGVYPHLRRDGKLTQKQQTYLANLYHRVCKQ